MKFFIFIVFFISGCSPVMLRNAETGEIAQCRQEGPFPIIHQLQCISSYKDQGWIKTTHKKERQLQASFVEKTDLCWKQIENHPQLNIIANKVALSGPNKQTFSMLTNTSKPTEAEKVAISIYANLAKNCLNEHSKGHTHPAYKLVNSSAGIAWENLLVTLYNGDLTYGEFAKAFKEISYLNKSALVEIDKEFRTNAANANARAEQIAIQRQNAFAAMQNARANEAAAGALKFQQRQKTSNSIHCTSKKFGGVVTTDCNEAPRLDFNLGR